MVAASTVVLAVFGLGTPPVAIAKDKDECAVPAMRQFYLTMQYYDGASALTACEPGYHMASMWEIFDPSNLVYDTNLGATQDDSGSGPPNDFSGWVRTGNNASLSGAGSAGSSNCDAWNSNDSEFRGTVAELVQSGWGQGDRQSAFVQPWAAYTSSCDSQFQRVWCVEDIPLR